MSVKEVGVKEGLVKGKELSPPSRASHNLFLRLPDVGRKLLIAMIQGNDVGRLDTAMVNKEGRAALLEAYKDTEVLGTKVSIFLTPSDTNSDHSAPEMLVPGLQWFENRGMTAREFTLDVPDNELYSQKSSHLLGLLSQKRMAMARMLITRCPKNYDVNSTHLFYAVRHQQLEIVKLLCERLDILSNLEARDESGKSILYWAVHGCNASNANSSCLAMLLDAGKKVNERCCQSLTPLHLACILDNIGAAILLIERGAELNALNAQAQTPIDLVDNSGWIPTLSFLQSEGALRADQLPVLPEAEEG